MMNKIREYYLLQAALVTYVVVPSLPKAALIEWQVRAEIPQEDTAEHHEIEDEENLCESLSMVSTPDTFFMLFFQMC